MRTGRASRGVLCALLLFTAIGAFGLGGTAADVVHLLWDPNPDAFLAGYHVYRADTISGPFSRLTEEPLDTPEFVDPTVERGQRYFYQVSAVAYGPLEGDRSEILEVVAGVNVSSDQIVTIFAAPGELVILSADRFGVPPGGGDWTQLTGPAVRLAQTGSGHATLVVPESGAPAPLEFSYGSPTSIRVRVEIRTP